MFHDVEGAKRKLEALDLALYPGENVTDCTSEAQRLNKVMQDAYAIPVNTGFNLLSLREHPVNSSTGKCGHFLLPP